MKSVSRAIFLGSKEFGLEIFKSLYNSSDAVEWRLLCPPDADDARTFFDEFNEFAESNDLDLTTVRSPDAVDEIVEDFKPEIMFVVGYYRILPLSLLEKVREGVWGIHNSLLPKYRGGSPLVWQLINGEERVGSSLFRFSAGMDDGSILHQVSFRNSSTQTIKTAMHRLQALWSECLPGVWKAYIEGEKLPFEQDHSEATYCAQRNEKDGLVDWSRSAMFLDRFIRAQARPYPMAFFRYGNEVVRIAKHELEKRTVYGACGQVFQIRDSRVSVCCGENTALELSELEVNGETVPAGTILNSIKIRLT